MRIQIQGASEHNLKDIDVGFGDGLTVVTGVSGSGKTSLVFDTLYHEARRRFLEVFALGSTNLRLAPARVRAITGLGPAVAVGQNLLNRNPGSTLATASGLHPFLRLLYARFGERTCPQCGAGLTVLSEDELVERLVAIGRVSPVRVTFRSSEEPGEATERSSGSWPRSSDPMPCGWMGPPWLRGVRVQVSRGSWIPLHPTTSR